MAKTKKEGWINIHRFWSVGGKAACSGPWESQKEAKSKRGDYDGYVTTIKIEWEE